MTCVLDHKICRPGSGPFVNLIVRYPLLFQEEPLQGLFVPVGCPQPVILSKGEMQNCWVIFFPNLLHANFQLLRQCESEIQVSISQPDLVVAGHLVPRGDRADGADTPGN